MAMATLTFSPGVAAVEWRIQPAVDVREMYSDNVTLAPSGSERADFITEVTPSISVMGNGRGLKFRGRYGVQFLHYARGADANRTAHQLDAAAQAELVDDTLFLDSSAGISQENISAFGPQPLGNHNVTGNRTTVKTFMVSPYLRNRFGSTADSEVRYTHSSVSQSREGLPSENANGVLLGLKSGAAFTTVGWGLQYNRQKFDGEDTQSVNSETTTGNLQYRVTPQFDLIAIGGYDKYDYVSIGDEPKGPFYLGGFSWRPSERTSLTASAGRRFWGNTYQLDARLHSRRTLWKVSYGEEITTTQSQLALRATNSTANMLNDLFLPTISDPVRRQRAVDQIMGTGLPASLSRSVNFFSTQFFLQKNLEATVAMTGVRNTVIFNLFNTSRTAQSAFDAFDPLLFPGGGGLGRNTKQTGAGALWNLRLTALTGASLAGSYTRVTEGTVDIRRIQRHVRAAISTQLQPNVTGGFELWRQTQASDLPSEDYVENVAAVFLSMRF